MALDVADVALVTPMAGRGVRFRRSGQQTPKPLVDLYGRPFFWWSTESVLRSTAVRELVFVVLDEHVERFRIDAVIRDFYPLAHIVTLPEATSGAAESAAIGIATLETTGAVAVNDCDHAFRAVGLQSVVDGLTGSVEGALLAFRADEPAYSYVRFDDDRRVVGTVEKQVVSTLAIAGCYLFADAATFHERYAAYRRACSYEELFVSGIYNEIVKTGGDVLVHELDRHVSFGTPDEFRRVRRADLAFIETIT
jgi:dTDP-glucose pyrophosphorylase